MMLWLRRLVLLVAAGSVMTLAMAGQATAVHDVPGWAQSVQVSIVPTFRQTISSTQCTARGGVVSSHGAPLAFTSCNPAAFLPGTRGHFGDQGSGYLQINVLPGDGDPTNGDQADVALIGTMQDVRDTTPTGLDYNPNPSPTGADMTATAKIRINDHFNTTTGQPCAATTSCPATMLDVDFPVPITCLSNSDPTTGSSCSAITSADAVAPDVAKEGKKAGIAIFRIRVRDAGANATVGDTDDRDSFMQGIYIP